MKNIKICTVTLLAKNYTFQTWIQITAWVLFISPPSPLSATHSACVQISYLPLESVCHSFHSFFERLMPLIRRRGGGAVKADYWLFAPTWHPFKHIYCLQGLYRSQREKKDDLFFCPIFTHFIQIPHIMSLLYLPNFVKYFKYITLVI